MNKEFDDFISNWNGNINIVHKSNPYSTLNNKSHMDLFKFCLDDLIKKGVNLNLKNFLVQVDEYKDKLKIKDFEYFLDCLKYNYHSKRFDNESFERKFIYEGQRNRGYEIVIERKVFIKLGEISPNKVSQKELDYLIMDTYMSELNLNNLSFSDSINHEYDFEYKFLFHQLNLYKNSTYRIRQWFKAIQGNKELFTYLDRIKFLQKVYAFFIKYNKLDSEYEKLTLLFKYYLEDSNFKFFESFVEKENVKKYGENLISLFKNDYLKFLISEFEKKVKKYINENDFVKSQIIENQKLLKKPEKSWLDSEKGYLETYTDLVNGKRENYYHDIEYSQKAGETEATQEFIKYLKNLTIKEKRKKAILKTNSEATLLPIDIFDNTRGYLKKNALQVNICYKYAAYDACFVLLRKITEILIIELYEKEEIEDKILDEDGHYFMLKKLIKAYQNEPKFKKLKTRSINESLPKIKKNGDRSAHSRRYNARKNDIDLIRDDFRIVFEEFINSIY